MRKSSSTSAASVKEQLQFSELRYRRLFETAQDGILILDADSGKIVDVNPFLKELLGYSEKEILGKELWEIGVFKDIKDSKEAFIHLQNEGYIRYKDLPLQTKDGRNIEVEFVSNVYMVDKEKVIQCNIRDITDRRKIEKIAKSRAEELEQLNKSQEETKKAMLNVMEDLEEAKTLIEIEKVRDEAMLASIGEGIIAVNNDREIMVINKAAEKILGWKRKELIGKKLTTFPLEDENGHPISLKKQPMHRALASGEMINDTYFFVKKDKSKLPMAITVTPIKLNGKTIGAIDIFRDISREKEIDKAKSEFVSFASHQLRTPLGIMKWYLEALENEADFKKLPMVIRDYFEEIYKSNERVLGLVRDLLSVSRIEQGHIKNIPKSVDITCVIKEMVAQMQILAAKKKIALSLIFQEDNIQLIDIDILRFNEVIENLIGNAIEYTNTSGKIIVTVNNNGKELIMKVKDTGIGISEKDKQQLFTKFFRSEKAFDYNPEGAGLGLYVVKAYVEDWGGKISAESKEGKGSIFTIILPISQKKS